MKVRVGLRLKFVLLFVVFMFLLGAVVIVCLQINCEKLFWKQYLDHAKSVAQIAQSMAEPDDLKRYAATGQPDEAYDDLIERMKEIQIGSGFYYLYMVTVENEEEGIYVFDFRLEDGIITEAHTLGEKNKLKKNYPGLSEVLATKEASEKFDVTWDGINRLDSVYVPVKDRETGEVAAFVGVDFHDMQMRKNIRELIGKALFSMAGMMALLLLPLLFLVNVLVIRPVRRLKKCAERVSEGQFGTTMKVRGHDELSQISEVFNWMSESISENMAEMEGVNETYYRYVPAKILTLLGKEDIRSIRLGDEVSAMLSVFSFQLADFDRNIRKKSTREMIDAINKNLLLGTSAVLEREGMVEYFRNSGFTAVFENGGEDALMSAVTICQRLNQLAAAGKIEKNRAEIGLSYGQVTLGIVGQERRMAAITVSQHKDIACWLQSIAEQYQAHILITREVADNVRDFFGSYRTRNLGFLYNTYTGYTGQVYDVYDGDSPEEISLKDATKELFEKGVEYFCLRDYKRARQKFIAVLRHFRRDRAAKEYLYLCDENMVKDPEETDIYFTKML